MSELTFKFIRFQTIFRYTSSYCSSGSDLGKVQIQWTLLGNEFLKHGAVTYHHSLGNFYLILRLLHFDFNPCLLSNINLLSYHIFRSILRQYIVQAATYCASQILFFFLKLSSDSTFKLFTQSFDFVLASLFDINDSCCACFHNDSHELNQVKQYHNYGCLSHIGERTFKSQQSKFFTEEARVFKAACLRN